MSKIDRFSNITDLIVSIADKRNVESDKVKNEIAVDFKNAFVSVYGKNSVNAKDCEEDEGFALIPAFIKNSIGIEYIGLVDICVIDGGELYASETQFLTNDYGWVTLDRLEEILSEAELSLFYPFHYKPLVTIEGCYKTDAQY